MDDTNTQNTFNLEPQGNTITLTFTQIIEKDQSSKQARLVVSEIESIFNKNTSKNFGILIDLTKLQNLPGFVTEESRQIYTEFSRNPQIYKIAVVGANLFYKIATNFLVTASRRGSVIKWFSDLEEAKEWLKAEQSWYNMPTTAEVAQLARAAAS